MLESSDRCAAESRNPELGPSPVSVSDSAVNANVRTNAGA